MNEKPGSNGGERPDAPNIPGGPGALGVPGTSPVLPLSGITVLDFSQFLAGPSCALRLADLGARVIKIERPDGGDQCRRLYLADARFDEDSTLFHAINRNKESYAADLKNDADLAAVRRLIARADVLIHNFRPGVMERLGLGPEATQALNPRLVHAAVSGYGDEGPWRDRPGQDLLVQALSGIALLSGNDDQPPVPAGLSITDMMAGAQLCQGILALLVRRGITGKGGRVDVSLLEAAIDLQFEHLSIYLNAGDGAEGGAGGDHAPMPRRSAIANGNLYLGAPYGIYATKDDWIALSLAPVDALGRAIGLDALAHFPAASWFPERDRIKALLRDYLCTAGAQHWLALLDKAGIWAAPVLDWPTLVASPAFAALHATQRVRAPDGALTLTRCPIRIDGAVLTSPVAAPRLGAQRAAIDRALARDNAS